MAITHKIHNVSYLSDVKFDLNDQKAMVAELDGTFSLPLAFIPAGAVITRVAVKTLENTGGGAVTVNVGLDDEKTLFVNGVDISAAPATSAVTHKTLADGVVALNVAALTAATGEAFVEYYLPATIKTEI